jgi:hypothetical protein
VRVLRLACVAACGAVLFVACANDYSYFQPPLATESDATAGDATREDGNSGSGSSSSGGDGSEGDANDAAAVDVIEEATADDAGDVVTTDGSTDAPEDASGQ